MKLTHQSKIPGFISVFKSFSKTEQKNFIKFTEISFFSKKRSYINILSCLKEVKLTDLTSENERIYSRLSHDLKLNKRALWNRLSELNTVAEYFLVNEKMKKDRLLRKSLFMEELNDRNQYEQIKKESVKAMKLIKETKLDDESFFNIQNIYGEISSFYSERNDYQNSLFYNKLQSDFSLLNFANAIYKQMLDFELRKRNNIDEKLQMEESLINSFSSTAIIEDLKKKLGSKALSAEVYYNLYLAFKKPENEHNYFHARDLFIKNKTLYSNEFKNSIYQYLRNYCIDKTNIGESVYYREIFKLNNSIIDEGLFKDLNVVNSQTNNFRNFIFAALRLNEYSWVEKFIADHSKELPDEIRNDEINLSRGILKINEKDYGSALSYLRKVHRKRYLHYLDTSVYKLIIFYETDDIEESYRETARLKDYLRQHKDIPVYLKAGYQKFIKLFETLLKLQQKYDITGNELFIVQMEPIKNVGLGSWLYEKGMQMLNEKSR